MTTGRLLIAATPLGQPSDASARLVRALGSADVIAAEDTRRIRTLAQVLEVCLVGRVVSLFDQNEASRVPALVDHIRGGSVVLLVSDAGMPLISDPGYRLVAATPHRADCSLEDLPVDRPLAVLFGTEEAGLSDRAMAAVDEYVRVPMYGFSESFNISVCAALILRELTVRMRTTVRDWGLTAEEQAALRLEWYRRSVRGVEHIESRFMEARGA